MRRSAAAFALILALVALPVRAHADRATDWVDPMIGTMGAGFVFPGPSAPYGMVQLSPDTDGYFAYTGYQWSDTAIRGFSHVHVQSMGVREGGHVPFMPTTGSIDTDVMTYASPFDHATEVAKAGYYAVTLERYGVRAELTAGMRTGVHRYTFPPGAQGNVLLDIGREIGGGNQDANLPRSTPGTYRAIASFVDDRTVVGTSNPDRTGADEYTVHFAARFDRPFAARGVWEGRGAEPIDADEVDGNGAGAYVSFDTASDPDVVVKVGISFVSVENALLNLESEMPGEDFDFEGTRDRTRAAWDKALSVIDVEGGTPDRKTAFTTALFHAQQHPNVFNDVNGDYIGYDNQVHRIGAPGDPMPAGSSYYANFSMWDTYRAEMPLLALIAPDRYRDMMRSLAAITVQGGRLPRWGLMNRYADFMNGEPALQVIADGYCRGLVPSDSLETLYAEMRDAALVSRRNADYLERGYVVGDASATLEHASGDFAFALMADDLGRADDAEQLLQQAGNWASHFDDGSGFLRPRGASTHWRNGPYYPEMPDGWREGTGWQYTWLVAHDARALFARMGEDEARRKLTTFFAGANAPVAGPEAQQKATLFGIAYYGNQYAPSNEHDLQAPWLWNWLGEPSRTQALVRNLQALYRATPDGLPGNDDLGTMSAWYVWSALGFYPVIPGAPLYAVGSPAFDRVTISLPGGAFTIEAPGASVTPYIGAVSLNGAPLERSWFGHDDLLPGGTLEVETSVVPTTWAAGTLPPSQSTDDLDAFACTP